MFDNEQYNVYEYFPENIRNGICEEIQESQKVVLDAWREVLEVSDLRRLDAAFGKLERFKLVFGLKGMKEFRQELIEILMKVIFIEEFTLNLIVKVAAIMVELFQSFRKSEGKYDLELEWRKFYKIVQPYLDPDEHTMIDDSELSLVPQFLELVICCSEYFPADATESILNEFDPFYCIFDHMAAVSMALLASFLPLERYELWLNDFIVKWKWSQASTVYGTHLLFRLAIHPEIGPKVNWNPYRDLIFEQILKFFGIIPHLTIHSRYWIHHRDHLPAFFAGLTVNMITNDNDILDRLQHILRTIQMYTHPNTNTNASNQALYLKYLSLYMNERLIDERQRKVRCGKQLNDAIVHRFFDLMMVPTFPGIFHSGQHIHRPCSEALKYLCPLNAKKFFSIIMPYGIDLLTNTSTSPGQACNMLEIFIETFQFLLIHKHEILEWEHYVVTMMSLTVDEIEKRNTRSHQGFRLILKILKLLPITTHFPSNYETEPPFSIINSIEQWILTILNKMFEYLLNTGPDSLVDKVFPSIMNSLYQNSSDEIIDMVRMRIYRFFTQNFLKDRAICCGKMIRPFIQNSKPWFDKYWNHFYDKIIETREGKLCLRHLNNDEIEYWCKIFEYSCFSCHFVVDVDIERMEVLLLELNAYDSMKGSYLSGHIQELYIRNLTKSLPITTGFKNDLCDRSLQWWNLIGKIDHERSIKWFHPSEETLQKAVQVYNHFTTIAAEAMKAYLGDENYDVKDLKRILVLLRFTLSGFLASCPQLNEDILNEYTLQTPASGSIFTKKPPVLTFHIMERSKLIWTREKLTDLMYQVHLKTIERNVEDAMVHTRMISCLGFVVGDKVKQHGPMKSTMNCALFNLENFYFKNQEFTSHAIRDPSICADIVTSRQKLEITRNLLQNRLLLVSQNYTKSHEKILEVYFHYLFSEFGQPHRYSTKGIILLLNNFSHKLSDKIIPVIVEKIQNYKPQKHKSIAEQDEHEVMAALKLLSTHSIIAKVSQDLNLYTQVVMTLINLNSVEKEQTKLAVNNARNIYVHASVPTIFLGKKMMPIFEKYIQELSTSCTNPMNTWSQQYSALCALHPLVRTRRDYYFPSEILVDIVPLIASDQIQVKKAASQLISRINKHYHRKVPLKVLKTNGKPMTLQQKTELLIPTNDLEWQQSNFFDPNYHAWISRKREEYIPDYAQVKRLSIKPESTEFERKRQAYQQLLLDTFRKPGFLKKFLQSHLEPTPGEFFFELLGIDMLRIFAAPLREFCQEYLKQIANPEELKAVKLIVKIMSQLVVESIHWVYDDRKEVEDFILELLDLLLNKTTDQCLGTILSFIDKASADIDPRRIEFLYNHLKSEIDAEKMSTKTIQQVSKVLSLLYHMFHQSGWRKSNWIEEVFAKVLPMIASPYHQIRARVGQLLSTVQYLAKPNRDSEGKLLVYGATENYVTPFIKTLVNAANSYNTQDEKVLYSIQKTCLFFFMNRKISLPIVHEILFREAMSFVLSHVMEQDDDKLTSDPDLFNYLKTALLNFVTTFSAEERDAILNLSKCIVENSKLNWRYRKLGLGVFATVLKWNQMEISRDTARNFLLDRLHDESVEIRNLASKILSTVFFYDDPDSLSSVTNQTLIVTRKLIHKHRKSTIPVADHHASVLLLSSIVQAHPFSLPKYVKQSLLFLSNQPQRCHHNVKSTIKIAFSQFWKAHKDEWEYGKRFSETFSEDERFLILNMTRGGDNYFV